MNNCVLLGDSLEEIKKIPSNSVHLILSDIPYGISYDDWDVLHSNTNSALLGSSPAQKTYGNLFKKRGKPLNGWSEEDKKIPKEYYDWCMKWASEWLRVLVDGGSAIIFDRRRLSHRCICALEDSGFIFKDMISWEKNTAAFKAQHISTVYNRRKDFVNAEKWKDWKLGNLRPLFEPILWFFKPYQVGGTIADNVLENGVGAFNYVKWHNYNSLTANIIKVSSNKDDHGLHPTQKPVSLMKALIELTTIEGQTVLGPFCGSGSTLVAAKELNRKYLGIEISKEYYDICNERLGKAVLN